MTTAVSEFDVLKVGLVGCGAVTQRYYAPALQVLEAEGLVRVAALLDPDAGSMAALRAVFPAAAPAGDLDAFADRRIDLAIVASPPRYHAEQTIRLLRDGISVLCEKPMATTVAEGEAMVATAAASRGLLGVGLVRRFLPAAQAIRDLLAQGALGDLQSFTCFEGGPFRWPVHSPAYFNRAVSGGGVFADIGVHLLDLLGWWLGPPTSVAYADDAMGGVEANCLIRLVYDGFEGTARLSRDWARPNRYVFEGSRGWLSWEVNEADRLQMGYHDARHGFDLQLREQSRRSGSPALGRTAAPFQQAFVDQLRNVVHAVRGTEALVVPGEAALPGLRLIASCYRNRTLLPMPWLSDAEYTRAQQLNPPAPLP